MNPDFCPLDKGPLSGLGGTPHLGLSGAVFFNLCEWRQERSLYQCVFFTTKATHLTEVTHGMEEEFI